MEEEVIEKLTEEQVRVVLSAVQATVPKGYAYYVVLCPQDLDTNKIQAIGNLAPHIVIPLLRECADSMEDPERNDIRTIQTS